MSGSPRLLRFALPPSLGIERAADLGSRLEGLMNQNLTPQYQVQVIVAASYPELAARLSAGDAHIGWAPPMVCARVENTGGRALVRAVRGGSSTYRSALICRTGRSIDPKAMQGLTAAWVDRDSTSGYLLPQAWMRQIGVDPEQAFQSERFMGSFADALAEVAAGRADVSATYASAPEAARSYLGPESLPSAIRESISVFAYTSVVPNDAIVASPLLPHTTMVVLRRRLSSMAQANAAAIREVFDAESLEEAPEGAYNVLYDLARETLG